MAWPPTVQQFKDQFFREFVYSDGMDSVTDRDIQRALNEVPPNFNQSLLDNLTDQTTAYLYAAAHYLVMNIRMAGGLGAIDRGRGVIDVGEGVVVASGIGAAQVTYQVPPERIASSPTLLSFFYTTFGQRYITMVSPRLIGNMAVVDGPGWCGGQGPV